MWVMVVIAIELQYEIQSVKVSTTRKFVSESLKYNVIRNLKRKYYSNKEEPSASNFLQKSKASANVKYISLPSKPSVDESCVERFLKAIRSGPVYFCVVCNRCLYKSNVVLFVKEKYNIDKTREKITDVRSFDNNFYICKTCHSKMKKSQVQCQAVYNKLFVDDIPEEISCLNQLELFLICKRF